MQGIIDFIYAYAVTPDGHAVALLAVALVTFLCVRIGVGILFPLPSYNPSAITAFLIGLGALGLWIVPMWGLSFALMGLILGLRSQGSWHKNLAKAGALLSVIGLALVAVNVTVGIYRLPSDILCPFLPRPVPGDAAVPSDGQPTAPTNTPIPTRAPTKTPTQLPANVAGCVNWTQVTKEMEGETVCVYGTIARIDSTEQWATRIDYSLEANNFFAFSATRMYSHPETQEPYRAGSCVMIEGEIELYGEIPYINLRRDPVQPCQTGMQ